MREKQSWQEWEFNEQKEKTPESQRIKDFLSIYEWEVGNDKSITKSNAFQNQQFVSPL